MARALHALGLLIALPFALVANACNKSDPAPASTPSGSIAPATLNTSVTPLSVGAPAPDLEAVAHNGEKVSLSALKGQPVVVYFYPKDNTAGCTVEAQEICDLWSEIGATNAVVIGVSTDDQASHKQFAEQHQLPFLLVPDPDGSVARKFGVPLSNGRARRVTFVIGRDGKVLKVFPDVTPRGHGQEILQALKSS